MSANIQKRSMISHNFPTNIQCETSKELSGLFIPKSYDYKKRGIFPISRTTAVPTHLALTSATAETKTQSKPQKITLNTLKTYRSRSY